MPLRLRLLTFVFFPPFLRPNIKNDKVRTTIKKIAIVTTVKMDNLLLFDAEESSALVSGDEKIEQISAPAKTSMANFRINILHNAQKSKLVLKIKY
ncbi:MAG: hypothetical protein NWF01_05040 [Candidatus Bathyarchaeota archaeon]|nr:hypothetical protein [Candidatus Bathyarchaeota archaeon]